MAGPRQFELMKRGAYFVAVSRGKLYNTEALVKALRTGRSEPESNDGRSSLGRNNESLDT